MTCRVRGGHLAGNRRARRVLVEAAWAYRYPAKVGATLKILLENLPKAVCDIAWKAQIGLCARCRPLSGAGINLPSVIGGARDRSLPMGDRPRGRTPVNRTSQPPGRTGGAEPRCGTPVASYVARLRPNRLLPNAVR